MHELSIAQGLIREVERLASENGLKKVTKIRLKIGCMQGVVEESLRLCIEMVSEGTPAEGAAVEMEETPLRVRCDSCGKEYEPEFWDLRCRDCPGAHTTVLSGKELLFEAMEGE